MEKIVLIDGNYWLFSSYYATAAMGNLMVNKDGIPTNAVFGFATRLENVIKQKPKAILVCFDAKGKTFRSEMQEDYKGTRKETPEELKSQFPIVREFLDAHHIAHYELEGYEGDDIIGTVSTCALKQGYQVDIMTGDKDMMQLIDDHIHVYKRNTKTKSDDVMTKETFKEKYDLEPDQMRDLLGLMGDSADNIPGIPGVGEKTALKLLKEYQTIENLKEHSQEIKGKMGEKIRANIELGLLSKQIATILRDVPMEINLDDYIYQGYDFDTLKDFYLKYDMHSFIKKMNKEASPVTQETTMNFQIVEKMPEIKEDSVLLGAIYDHNYHKSIVLGYALYNATQAYYISYEKAIEDESFKNYLQDETKKKGTYDLKAQLLSAKWNGLEIKGYDFDLQLASYILNPSLKDEMKYICDYYEYDEPIYYEEEVFGKGAKKHIPDDELLAKHLISKAKAIYDLKQEVIERLKTQEQYDLYQNVEMPVAFILADMEFNGVKVDKDCLKEMEKDFNDRILVLEKEIHELAGQEFNIASPKQLGEILFEKLQLPYAKKTKTGYSTSVDVLEKLRPVHPIVDKVLEYRAITKLFSTYIIGLQEQIFMDGKIHTMYNQALTQTGRLSSTDPNLQNIPVRSEEGRMIRKAFVPSFDYIVSFDYSQIELRILAHMANVTSLIDAFNKNEDIHSKTAKDIFDVEEVTKDQRRHAKAINFGIIYGMSDYGLAEQVGVNVATAREFIQKYFATYPGIKEYMDGQIDFCKEHGYVATLLNRKRYIREINDKNYMVRELGKRLAMNSPIQGSGADILKIAMIKVDKAMKEKNMKSKMILQVHDELIFDVVEDELDEMMKLIQTNMEDAVSLKVKLKAEGTYGKSWYELK